MLKIVFDPSTDEDDRNMTMLNRQCRPRRRTVRRLADALGTTPQDLWPGFTD